MRLLTSLILACAVWLAAAQASASIEAVLESNADFCDISASITYSCSKSTPYNDIEYVDWDWDNDGNWDDEDLLWPDDATVEHYWSEAGIYYVKVRVKSDTDSDTAILGPICVADPGIVIDVYCIDTNTDVGYDATDCSFPDTVNKTYQWDFDGDSHIDSTQGTYMDWNYHDPGWYFCKVWVKYDSNPNWVAHEWAYIQVHQAPYCP